MKRISIFADKDVLNAICPESEFDFDAIAPVPYFVPVSNEYNPYDAIVYAVSAWATFSPETTYLKMSAIDSLEPEDMNCWIVPALNKLKATIKERDEKMYHEGWRMFFNLSTHGALNEVEWKVQNWGSAFNADKTMRFEGGLSFECPVFPKEILTKIGQRFPDKLIRVYSETVKDGEEYLIEGGALKNGFSNEEE